MDVLFHKSSHWPTATGLQFPFGALGLVTQKSQERGKFQFPHEKNTQKKNEEPIGMHGLSANSNKGMVTSSERSKWNEDECLIQRSHLPLKERDGE